MIKNKKGFLLAGDFPLWFFRFFLLVLIIAGIALVVYTFYSRNIDTREAEVNLITNKIANCIIKNSTLQEIDSLSLEKCGLSLNQEENYVNISIRTYGSDTSLYIKDKSFYFGNIDFEVYCRIKGIKMPYQPFCSKQKFYSLKNSEGVYVDVLVASTKGLK